MSLLTIVDKPGTLSYYDTQTVVDVRNCVLLHLKWKQQRRSPVNLWNSWNPSLRQFVVANLASHAMDACSLVP